MLSSCRQRQQWQVQLTLTSGMEDAGLGLGGRAVPLNPMVALPEPGRAVLKIDVLVALKPA